jgi:hypothetical protein
VTDGNTSSMASHLLSTHSTSQEVLQHWQSLLEQGVDLKHNKPFLDKLISKSGLNQQTMHQFFTNSSMPALTKTRLYTQQTFHKYICNLVCENNISVHTICSPGMKEFIGWLNVVALRDMPNAKKVRRLVEEQYETMRDQTNKLIRESATKISLTIDGWTSRDVKGNIAIVASHYTFHDEFPFNASTSASNHSEFRSFR